MFNRRVFFPQARAEELIVPELDDEILIYDKALCLNQTAAQAWKAADGKRTIAEIAVRLEKDSQVPVNERVVWYALDQLGKDHLLREDLVVPKARASMTRRELAMSTAPYNSRFERLMIQVTAAGSAL